MRILAVSEFVEVVNAVLSQFSREEFAVEGEVSGYRLNQGQWITFDLKDEKALVNVFMPRWNLTVPVEEGMRVRVFGAPRIYAKYGKFSFSAERVELVGEGALRRALALLRERLLKEGLFDPSRKRALPRFPRRIALVASRESAAYGDFLRVLGERWGGVQIDLYHVLVQGERAPQEIVSALETAQHEEYDALVMTRGGGSLEELMAFNDERVVRAVHASRIPTLVGIGHERDVTLAEEAADVRGSTPTDCARRLVPDRRDVQYELSTLVESIDRRLMEAIASRQNVIRRAVLAPLYWLSTRRARLERAALTCQTGATHWLRALRERFKSQTRLLASLDPKAVLSRGYAMVQDTAGRAIPTVTRLKAGDAIRLILRDGQATSVVSQVDAAIKQQQLL